jgi:hypothetical protein
LRLRGTLTLCIGKANRLSMHERFDLGRRRPEPPNRDATQLCVHTNPRVGLAASGQTFVCRCPILHGFAPGWSIRIDHGMYLAAENFSGTSARGTTQKWLANG